YLWTDKGGSSFSARFENNKLVRKSGFYVRPTPIDEKQMTEERQAEENMEGAVEMNPTEEGGENPIEEEKTEVVEEPVYQQPNRVVPQSVNKEPTQTRPDNRRIVYAGSPRKFSDENREADFVKQSSLKRKAKLPGYTYQLRDGSYEIKIYNPLDTSVKVGLRSGKRGKDISIPSGGVKAVKVPRGDYQFVYIRDDEPYEVQQGGSVQIDGLFVGDIEIMLLK
ncbi:MAG: hypothetical protein ACP5QY_10915, partial [Candidatus Hydrogenedens sp.]